MRDGRENQLDGAKGRKGLDGRGRETGSLFCKEE